ncbi:MAG: cobaltochelatase subunit CobN, partial [Pseudomonadales bacterium]
MHLLAAKPGGFVDEEGIIDLQQDPAEIVILSAADSQLAALSAGLASSELASAEAGLSVRIANWMALSKPAAYDLYEHKVLQHATLVVVSLLGGRNYWPYGFERLCDWARGAGRTLILVPGDDTPDPELTAASDVSAEQHSAVWRFLRESGAQNSRDLLHYLAAEFFARNYPWQAAKALPRALLYWPESTQSTVTYTQCCAHWQDDSPVVALLFYRSHLQSANTAVFDGLIAKLIAAGLNPLPLAISSLKDEQAMAVVNTLLTRSEAALILNTTGFASNRSDGPQLASQPSDYRSPFARDIPVLQLVLSSSTEEDWQSFSQGLRARDVAMQVALPELDGRILSRAVSFKAASYTDELAQLDVVRYALHAERADFVIELARRYCTLGAKPNAHKRLAVILANYPTKDGRIGNGVGLDTPNSCINLLRALQREGYPLPEELPENGNALIEQLLQSVTNNPNTLHYLGCWQSLEITEYRHFFAALPTDAQRAVLERWGEPEADIKARDGRLMIAGIRLGETFIGIQPARGYNLDL